MGESLKTIPPQTRPASTGRVWQCRHCQSKNVYRAFNLQVCMDCTKAVCADERDEIQPNLDMENTQLRQPCDEIHPDCQVPEGFVWMLPGEMITPGCMFTRKWDPKWYTEGNKPQKPYKPGYHHPMIRPQPDEANA